jgi:hypothetical protein
MVPHPLLAKDAPGATQKETDSKSKNPAEDLLDLRMRSDYMKPLPAFYDPKALDPPL